MNLRIEGQQLRFRISKDELDEIYNGNEIAQLSHFLDGQVLNIRIIPQDIDVTLYFAFTEGVMSLIVNKQEVKNLYDSLPSREGVSVKQSINDTMFLNIILEVDIFSQKRLREHK